MLAADYAEDAVLVTLDGSFIGREAIFNGFFQPLLAQFPDIKINFEKTAVEDDVCLLQWSAEASAVTVPKGTAVFIIQGRTYPPPGRVVRDGAQRRVVRLQTHN